MLIKFAILVLLAQTLASPAAYGMLQLLIRVRQQELLFKYQLTTGEYLLKPTTPQVKFVPDLTYSRPVSIISKVLNNRIIHHYCRADKAIKVFAEKWHSGEFIAFEPKEIKLNKMEYINIDLSLLAPIIDYIFFDVKNTVSLQQLLYFNSIVFLSSGGRNFNDGFESFTESSRLLRWFYQSHKALLVFFLEAMPYYNGQLNFLSGYTATSMSEHIEESKKKILEICRSHKEDRKLLAAGFTLILNLDRIKDRELSNTCDYFKELVPYILKQEG